MPNTITFISHRMRTRFARVHSSKLTELASLMWRRDDTQEREMLDLLEWAIPALELSEVETVTGLHQEDHSRAAGLNQRLAAAEQDGWDGLIERALQKQLEEEDRKHANSNQLADKEQPYLRRMNRAVPKANNGCLRAAKKITMGGKQATPCEETTKMIQAKLPREELPEDEWTRMNEEIEECEKLAWKVQPLSKRRVLLRLEWQKKRC